MLAPPPIVIPTAEKQERFGQRSKYIISLARTVLLSRTEPVDFFFCISRPPDFFFCCSRPTAADRLAGRHYRGAVWYVVNDRESECRGRLCSGYRQGKKKFSSPTAVDILSFSAALGRQQPISFFFCCSRPTAADILLFLML
jgi:hypothetical protein